MTCARCKGPHESELYGLCPACTAHLREWAAGAGDRAKMRQAEVQAEKAAAEAADASGRAARARRMGR